MQKLTRALSALFLLAAVHPTAGAETKPTPSADVA